MSDPDLPIPLPRPQLAETGVHPGIEPADLRDDSADQPVEIECFDYSIDQIAHHRFASPGDIAAFLSQPRPIWSNVRWIHVRGTDNAAVIRQLSERFELHPLAVEDALTMQRSKVDDYPASQEHPGRLFVIVRYPVREANHLRGHQVAIFLGKHTLVTIQKSGAADLFDPIRQQLNLDGSRLRGNDTSFLLYSLVDCIVDNLFPLLDAFARILDRLDDAVMNEPDAQTRAKIYRVKRELMLLHRYAWPLREMVHHLCREPHECLTETTRTYLRDVHDHLLQAVDFVLTYREFASELAEAYMSAVSNRLNDIMKILTIINTVFVPLTFVAGVYGMNVYIPEAGNPWVYPLFWLGSITTATIMLLWFRRRRWF